MSRFLTIIFLTIFSCVAGAGQETESAATLELTGTSLPANAQRVLREHVPAEIERTLENLVAAGNGKLRRGETEVVLWTGGDLKSAGTQSVIGRLTGALKTAGWKYEIGGTENDVTFFSLLKGGVDRRAIIGFYGEADGTLLLALTELHVADGGPTNSSASAYGENVRAGDYSFTTPAGWSRSDSGGKIVLSKGGQYKIEFLAPMESSGNLERDAQVILWQVFRDYDAWFSNGFEADYGTFEKGRTVQGLEYFRVYRYIKKIGDENNGFARSKLDAIILLVKLGDKVAVIAGTQPFQTDFTRGSTLQAIDFILYDLAFKNAPGSLDLKNELLGSWSAAGGSVGLAYTFNANGTFHKGAATEFRTEYDERRQKVRTMNYAMTQSYSLSGNVLTQNYKQTGEVYKYKIRIYHTRYDKNAWQQKLGFLPLDGNDGEPLVLQKGN